MERFDARVDGDTYYVDSPEGELAVGAMSDIVELLGETYTIEYDEEQQIAGWLQTEEGGTISFDVRETLAGMDYDETMVRKIAGWRLDVETPEGYPRRTAEFADLMAEIWDSKGTIEVE